MFCECNQSGRRVVFNPEPVAISTTQRVEWYFATSAFMFLWYVGNAAFQKEKQKQFCVCFQELPSKTVAVPDSSDQLVHNDSGTCKYKYKLKYTSL